MSEVRKILNINNVIRAWEISLFHDRFLMSPSTVVIAEATIHHLKEYKYLEEKAEKRTENSL